jgi:hypothetical protein
MWTLDEVLDRLERHRQRATYGAVGQLVGRPPLYLMQGRDRSHRNSWIVAKATGLPTGYEEDDMHPALRERPEVLRSGEELEFWLRTVD